MFRGSADNVNWPFPWECRRVAHNVRYLELAAMGLFVLLGLPFHNQIIVRLGHGAVHPVLAWRKSRAKLLALTDAHRISKAGASARRWDGGKNLCLGKALLTGSARKVVHQHVQNV